MSTATRRSSRLSGSHTDESHAGPSSRTSAVSSVIPAARSKATGKERRLEDLLGADETRMDLSVDPFLPPPKPRSRKAASSSELFASDDDERVKPARPSRRPRKTIGEEAEDDFIFKRDDGGRKRTQSGSSAARASTSKRTFEPLLDEEMGETPIIRRNKAYRAGLDLHPNAQPRLPSSRSSGTQRRSSLGLKSSRRISSLRDGMAAYPHDDVPDHELHRHCSADLPPVRRMRHLLAWVLKRSFDAALGKVDPPDTKGKRKKAEIPRFTEAEKQLLADKESLFRSVLEQLLADLNDGAFSIDWVGVSEEVAKRGKLQPHPRNVANKETEAQQKATKESMTAEAAAWARERHRLEEYEAETQRLQDLLHSKEEADDEVIEWSEGDLDEAGLRQLKDARDALGWLDRLLDEAASEEAGTEQDPRWRDVEFKVDLLRSRSHQFSQLESLASRYVNTVSAQAAQALRDRTSSASKANQSGDKLERLLSGVRESRSEFGQTAQEGMQVEEAFEPDESDAMDLLRALANS